MKQYLTTEYVQSCKTWLDNKSSALLAEATTQTASSALSAVDSYTQVVQAQAAEASTDTHTDSIQDMVVSLPGGNLKDSMVQWDTLHDTLFKESAFSGISWNPRVQAAVPELKELICKVQGAIS